MHLLKLALISLVVFFLSVTVIGLLFPSTATVSRGINIHAPQDSVYKYISDFKYWTRWMQTNNTRIQFVTKSTTGEGAIIQIATQEIKIDSLKQDLIQTNWKNEKGDSQTGLFQISKNPEGNSTTVQWFFLRKLKWYPWVRFAAMIDDKIYGPAMDSSLYNLRKAVEN